MSDRHDPAVCGICARQSIGIGYRPPNTKPPAIMWLCDDLECIQTARAGGYDMKQDNWNRIESMAAQDGGSDGGEYLDQIGKFNLAELTPDEWAEFCRRIVGGYRKALAKRTAEECPF